MSIYLDTAATSAKRPECVAERMSYYLSSVGTSVNRGSYGSEIESSRELYSLRQSLCKLFNCDSEERAIITSGATMSLNTAILGLLCDGDRVLYTSMEHNSVLRPIASLGNRIDAEMLMCDAEGRLDTDELVRSLKRKKTRAVILNHASNVCGTLQDAETVGKLCREYGAYFILDCSQTAGHVDIDMQACCADAIAASGHKGLMGPSGIGVLMLSQSMAEVLHPIVFGGTGSFSDSVSQPEALPDRFESGTPNVPGIFGLNAALGFVNLEGAENMHAHEQKLTGRFVEGLREIEGIRFFGGCGDCVGTCSVTFDNIDNAEAAYRLETEFGIYTRCGLHCAPWAHKTLGTYPRGSVSPSYGHYHNEAETDSAIEALKSITRA